METLLILFLPFHFVNAGNKIYDFEQLTGLYLKSSVRKAKIVCEVKLIGKSKTVPISENRKLLALGL